LGRSESYTGRPSLASDSSARGCLEEGEKRLSRSVLDVSAQPPEAVEVFDIRKLPEEKLKRMEKKINGQEVKLSFGFDWVSEKNLFG
jgi:hypothetical protein